MTDYFREHIAEIDQRLDKIAERIEAIRLRQETARKGDKKCQIGTKTKSSTVQVASTLPTGPTEV